MLMKDPQGNIHNVNWLEGTLRENSQGWQRLNCHEVSCYKRTGQITEVAPSYRRRDSLSTTSADSNQQVLTNIVNAAASGVYDSSDRHSHHYSDSSSHSHSSSGHDHSSSSSHDYSSSSDCSGSFDSGSDCGF